MKIKFYAHASFRLEGSGISVVTDPYTPALSGFDPIRDPADLVVMSSSLDQFHCDPSHVGGQPQVVNALDLPADGAEILGLRIEPYLARERWQWGCFFQLSLPRPFAMYGFTLDGVRVLHTGDLSRRIPAAQIERLRGQVDVMLVVAGVVHTIRHRDLLAAIEAIQPKVVIPMHCFSPKGVLKLYPVERFTDHFEPSRVVRTDGSQVEFHAGQLPASTEVYVMEQSR